MKGATIAAAIAVFAALRPPALAASRARYGGALRAAIATRPPESDPSIADAPPDAAIVALSASPICRLDAGRRLRPVLASEIAWQEPQQLRVALRPGLRFADGGALSAKEVLASWSRLSHPSSLSPYRALLFPLREEGRRISPSPSAQVLDLPLAFPWPDLAASLCHPALAVRGATGRSGVGPFKASSSPNELEANSSFPLGRPYLDKISLSFVDERGAARLFALGQAQLAIGNAGRKGSAAGSPALYATYLVFRPERAGSDFRRAFEAAIDRSDLTRFFVPAPALPMDALLPPGLMPQEPVARSPTAAQSNGRALTLLYDQSLPEQRLVAERLQLKLHDLKYAVALKPVPRAALRTAWAAGQFDLMLHAVHLPPAAGPALAVALEVAGRHELLSTELPPIGAVSDDADRQRTAVERARALLPSLALIPLYAQGVSAATSERLASFGLDGYGLPALDDAFLLPE